MVQFSQTSWQEYTLTNMLETMRYAPMNMTIGKNPVVHYTLPQALEAGEIVRYAVVVGFRKVTWTGRISAINNGKIMVRLEKGPFRGGLSPRLSASCVSRTGRVLPTVTPASFFAQSGVKSREPTPNILFSLSIA